MRPLTNSGPLWYLAEVINPAALAGRPQAEHFTLHLAVYFWASSPDRWMVFDGADHYTILPREQVKAALRSRRDENQKLILADDQEGLTRRFYLAVRKQGGASFACRPSC
jgi:hypothetical protein